MPDSRNRVYLPAVDHLRAGFALLILFYHGWQHFSARLQPEGSKIHIEEEIEPEPSSFRKEKASMSSELLMPVSSTIRGEKENDLYYGMSSSGNELAQAPNGHFLNNNESFY